MFGVLVGLAYPAPPRCSHKGVPLRGATPAYRNDNPETAPLRRSQNPSRKFGVVMGPAYPAPHRGSHKGVPLRGATPAYRNDSGVSAFRWVRRTPPRTGAATRACPYGVEHLPNVSNKTLTPPGVPGASCGRSVGADGGVGLGRVGVVCAGGCCCVRGRCRLRRRPRRRRRWSSSRRGAVPRTGSASRSRCTPACSPCRGSRSQ